MLHICLVTFISFISFTKVQLIHFVIHLIHFTASLQHSSYCIVIQPHCVFHVFNQSRLWKLTVFLDKVLMRNMYCII